MSTLEHIEKLKEMQREALLGGGEKRIEAQHDAATKRKW